MGGGGSAPAAGSERVTDAESGAVSVALAGTLWPAFGRPGSPGAGGWVLGAVAVRIAGVVATPALVGFRRRRGEPRPSGPPIGARPDWVQEIARVSPSPGGVAGAETTFELWARARVPHLWMADPGQRTLT